MCCSKNFKLKNQSSRFLISIGKDSIITFENKVYERSVCVNRWCLSYQTRQDGVSLLVHSICLTVTR